MNRNAIEREVGRAIDVMRRQHKALSTERDYAGWLRRYFRFVYTLPRELTREKKVEAFLTCLARVNDVAASTQNVAFNAILFFYKDVLGHPLQGVDALRASRPAHVRHALPKADTMALLKAVKDSGGYPTNLIVRMLYGCGLRVTEPLNLRIKDVDLGNSKLAILGAKGRKDRIVKLPCSLAEEIRSQMDYARAVWQRDGRAKMPVEMPHQLARKYPEFRFAWSWAWLFPARYPCPHPRTGEVVRYRMHEANVQRAVKDARLPLGLYVTPHHLRHCYATHCLEHGVNIQALKEAMGHECIETTSGYCHADALSVGSPLDFQNA